MLSEPQRCLAWLAATVVVALGPCPVGAQGGDRQYWNECIFELSLCQPVTLEAASEQQFVDDMSDFALYNVTIEPSYKLTSRTSLGLGYRYEREKEEGEWATENRYWVHHSIKWPVVQCKMKLKSTFEFRDLVDEDEWRFRTKLTVERKLRLGWFAATPFVSEEPFYDLEQNEWNQNRVAGGLSFDLAEGVELSLYCLNKSKKSDDEWKSTNVVGTEMVFSF